MTRHFKSMQADLLGRLHKLETANAELQGRLEDVAHDHRQAMLAKETEIEARDREIADLKLKTERMADEFGRMLTETLGRLSDRLEQGLDDVSIGAPLP
jgi:predicted RNase H-like nuclease (RuvC/YqgF family)